MLLIFSSHANHSKQIRREVQRAFDRDVPVVPFRVENVLPEKSLAYFMGPVHWLDALTPPLEQHLQRLAASVKALVQARTQSLAAELEGLQGEADDSPTAPTAPLSRVAGATIQAAEDRERAVGQQEQAEARRGEIERPPAEEEQFREQLRVDEQSRQHAVDDEHLAKERAPGSGGAASAGAHAGARQSISAARDHST